MPWPQIDGLLTRTRISPLEKPSIRDSFCSLESEPLISTASGMSLQAAELSLLRLHQISQGSSGLLATMRATSSTRSLTLPLRACRRSPRVAAGIANSFPSSARSTDTTRSWTVSEGKMNPSSLYPKSLGLRIITAQVHTQRQNSRLACLLTRHFE